MHLVLCDSYDPRRVPPVPLPLPPGAHPARLTTLPPPTDLVIEMVSGDTVTVLPTWIVEPYLDDHDLVTVRIQGGSQRRSWYCATRHGPRPEPLEAFVELLTEHLATTGLARTGRVRRQPV